MILYLLYHNNHILVIISILDRKNHLFVSYRNQDRFIKDYVNKIIKFRKALLYFNFDIIMKVSLNLFFILLSPLYDI